MRTRKTCLLLSALITSQAWAQSPWTTLVKDDINYIYTSVQQNHPGFVDDENPYFRQWLETGYKQAMEQAETSRSLDDAMTVIQSYVAGFADGHFYLNLAYRPKRLTWAGIELSKFGADYRVTYTDPDQSQAMPSSLSRLVSCDGKPAETIMNEDVLKHRFNAPQLNYPKVGFASKILIDDGIGQRQQYKSCTFESGGKRSEIPLVWSRISHTRYVDKTTKTKQQRRFSFEDKGNNEYWVTLPRFYPNEEEQKALRKVIANIEDVRNGAKRFVIDVRGNNGGNSEWGVEVAKALFGGEFITEFRAAHPDTSYALWRASKDNADYLASILPMLETQFGPQSDMLKDFSALTDRMYKGIEDKVVLVRQSPPDELSERPVLSKQSYSGAEIVFLTDSRCGSACLDFADLMLQLPAVNHVGQETAADTVYMDIRSIKLPSGLGSFSLAQKVYRDRPRAHNESYVPRHQYDGDISDTQKVSEWLDTLKLSSE